MRIRQIFVIISFVLPIFLGGCYPIQLSKAVPETIPKFQQPQYPIKIAFILGGGGSKGLAHLGVITELEHAGIHPDLIVGCSSGAIVGALYADQPNISRLKKVLLSLKRSDLIDISIFSFQFGLVKGVHLKKFLSKNLIRKKFDELPIPFIAVATDLKTGKLIEFGRGEMIQPIMASAAVPGVFNPIYYKGRYLVDGGVANPIPVSVAKKYGAQIIIAVDVGADLSEKEPNHFFGVAKRGLEIAYRKLSEHVARDADVVIRMNFQDVGMFSDTYNQQIYEHGRKMARAMLPQIEKLIQEQLPTRQEPAPPTWSEID